MITYNKPGQKKSRVLKSGSGPRDVQRRQRENDSNIIVDTLRQQIEILTKQLTGQPSAAPVVASEAKYTAEEFDSELIKHVEKEAKKIEKKYKDKEDSYKKQTADLDAEVDEFVTFSVEKAMTAEKKVSNKIKEKLTAANHEIEVLNEKLKSSEEIMKIKDDTIEMLKTRPVGSYEPEIIDTPEDRPQMSTVFIDPTEEGAGNKMASHINIKDVSITEKEKMVEKVNKLKSLVGGGSFKGN